MEYIAMNRGYAGYWGAGETEEAAVKAFRKAGGTKVEMLVFVHEFYEKAYIDGMGNVMAYAKDGEAEDWPPVIAEVWETTSTGKRKKLIQH